MRDCHLSDPQSNTSKHYTDFVDVFFIVVVTIGIEKSIELYDAVMANPLRGENYPVH